MTLGDPTPGTQPANIHPRKGKDQGRGDGTGNGHGQGHAYGHTKTPPAGDKAQGHGKGLERERGPAFDPGRDRAGAKGHGGDKSHDKGRRHGPGNGKAKGHDRRVWLERGRR